MAQTGSVAHAGRNIIDQILDEVSDFIAHSFVVWRQTHNDEFDAFATTVLEPLVVAAVLAERAAILEIVQEADRVGLSNKWIADTIRARGEQTK